MLGITDVKIALPGARLSLEKLNQAWDRKPIRGGKAVAGPDEDSLALAAEAAADLGAADYLAFASTTPPLLETSPAAFAAALTDQPENIHTADFTGSLAASTKAISSALDFLEAHDGAAAIVAAGDTRLAEPGSIFEPMLGDGGAAVKLSGEEVLAEIFGRHSVTRLVRHTIRRPQDQFINPGDYRYIGGVTSRILFETAISALEKLGMKPEEFDKWVISAPDPKAPGKVMKKLGLNPKEKSVFPPAAAIGFTGTADPITYLGAALENASPGDKIAWMNFGDGADFFALKATDKVKDWGAKKPVSTVLKSGRELPDYAHYLRLKTLMKGMEGVESGFTSSIMMDREEWALRLQGLKCGACGEIITIELKVCPRCVAKGGFSPYKLSRTGKIFTYTQEHYFPAPEPPLGMAVIDLDSRGRLTVQSCTECELKVGAKVKLVPRRYHDIGGLPHYFWKAKNLHEGEE